MRINLKFKKEKNVYKITFPFHYVFHYIRTISTYAFRQYIINNFDATIDEYNHIHFKNKEDLYKLVDWINSIVVMNDMTDDEKTKEKNHYPVFDLTIKED